MLSDEIASIRPDDVFEHAIRQVHRPAPPELVAGFKEKMEFIRIRYKHNQTTVESCLRGLGESPTLLQVLTAAFVINGGVLFKHGPLMHEQEQEEQELSRLIQEFDELGAEEDQSHRAASNTSTKACELA